MQVASNDAVMSDVEETALGSAIAQSDEKPVPETDTRAAALNTRSRIASIASKYVGSTAWSNAVTNGRYGPGSNKCNLFVYDVLTEAGASPGLPHGVWPLSSYPPVASDWADPGYAIPGWAVLSLNERAEEGDVIAQKISYSDAGGHVMIVGPNATLIGTGESDPGKPPGTIEQIPMQSTLTNRSDVPHGPLVFRRWVGR